MRISDYKGFKTARERREYIIKVTTEINDAEDIESLELLKPELQDFYERIKAEINEGSEHHGFDYEQHVKDIYLTKHQLLTQIKEFICY